MLDLRFLEVGVDIELTHRNERHQALAGRNEIAFLDRAVTDNAVIRRFEHGEGEVAGGFVARDLKRADRAFGLSALGLKNGDVGMRNRDVGVAAGQIGLRLVKGDIGVVEIGSRADRLRLKLALALLGDLGAANGRFECHLLRPRLHEAGIGAFDLCVDALQRKLFGGDLGLGQVEGVLIVAVIKRGEHVARFDFLVGDHIHLRDVARDLRRNRCDIALDIGVVGRHHEAAVRPPFVTIPAAAGEKSKHDDRQHRAAALLRSRGRGNRSRRRLRGGRRLFQDFRRRRLSNGHDLGLCLFGSGVFADDPRDVTFLVARHGHFTDLE